MDLISSLHLTKRVHVTHLGETVMVAMWLCSKSEKKERLKYLKKTILEV